MFVVIVIMRKKTSFIILFVKACSCLCDFIFVFILIVALIPHFDQKLKWKSTLYRYSAYLTLPVSRTEHKTSTRVQFSVRLLRWRVLSDCGIIVLCRAWFFEYIQCWSSTLTSTLNIFAKYIIYSQIYFRFWSTCGTIASTFFIITGENSNSWLDKCWYPRLLNNYMDH